MIKKTWYKWANIFLTQNLWRECESWIRSKADFKKATGVVTSDFAKNANLASLKLDVDELDTSNLKTVPVDLSKLSNAINNVVVKRLYMIT